MASTPTTLYKLIILFCLDSVNVSLTNAVISEYILSREFTSYFNIQTALNELSDANLISSTKTYKSTYYSITEDGKETLKCFHYEISQAIKDDIKKYFKEHIGDIVEKLSTFADYTLVRKNEYKVTCNITERDTILIDLSLTVPDEKTAQSVCSAWHSKCSDIYSFAITNLIK